MITRDELQQQVFNLRSTLNTVLRDAFILDEHKSHPLRDQIIETLKQTGGLVDE
tara:strand:+ start:550 stop:711 length:162 start_codon:yes stop_codon:yes gene_type:complete